MIVSSGAVTRIGVYGRHAFSGLPIPALTFAALFPHSGLAFLSLALFVSTKWGRVRQGRREETKASSEGMLWKGAYSHLWESPGYF